jgi:hypothetical protein
VNKWIKDWWICYPKTCPFDFYAVGKYLGLHGIPFIHSNWLPSSYYQSSTWRPREGPFGWIFFVNTLRPKALIKVSCDFQLFCVCLEDLVHNTSWSLTSSANITLLTTLKVVSKQCQAGHQWLTPVILATWEAEIRRILVWDQPRQIVHETPSPK